MLMSKKAILEPIDTTEFDKVKAVLKTNGGSVLQKTATLDELETFISILLGKVTAQTAVPQTNCRFKCSTSDSGELVSVGITVALKKKVLYSELHENLNRTYSINPLNADEIIDDIVAWVQSYSLLCNLMHNVKELNATILELCAEAEVPFDVEFTVGSGLAYVSDTRVVVGLEVDQICRLDALPILVEDDARYEGHLALMVDMLKAADRPIDILKSRKGTTLLVDLNLLEKRSYAKLIRRFVSRKIEFVKDGVGYFDNGEVFALIEATKAEDGTITKSILLSPFNKKTGKQVDFDLSAVLA